MTSSPPGSHRHQAHGGSPRELLELDAAVTGAYLDEAITLIRAAASGPPATIVDVGAGTGVGTRALAAAFPDAEIIAIDGSADMTAGIAGAGTGHLRAVTADLDDGWPQVGAADVVWASGSLHHLADPLAFLHTARAHLRGGGVLAIIEMAHQPRFLQSGLDDRIEAIMRAKGANAFPDWTDTIIAAGFEMRGRHSVPIVVAHPTPTSRAYAQAWLTRVRSGLADDLGADDLATIDALLGDSADSLRHRPDLQVQSTRLIWIATAER
ncbi:class I SAM-dependent methyltransferase [Gordonia sp. DT30]|uniref:class I SAM-dependent methyltransferase n=1 Tax=Gordonia sp. DT30 TaxID=3416546 RepID=UPI003CEA558A